MQGILGVMEKASRSIRIVDDYVTDETLDLLIFAKIEVEVKIYSKNRPMISNLRNYRRRKAFSKGLKFILTNRFSNRYVVIDDKFLYILSAPLAKIDKKQFNWIRILEYEKLQDMLRLMSLSERARRRI